MTFGQKVLVWLYSLIAAAISSVGTAATAWVSGKVFGAADFTLRQLGMICVGGAIVGVLGYLKSNPLPLPDGTVKP